ncbi:FAD-dependent oxidoreductase [Thiococcus pfennigii]|nr:L-2-hydroxyglutarate oxidase [Thiococcus pfennigii]MBK1699568.1 FAD-dependent oxidoreductase [Thiococcus pfennigii]MBK1731493.1 FAD-dependent oxidoreductase [Thiococcus pfennigii]
MIFRRISEIRVTCNKTADFLIIGGGIIGVMMACQAKRRHPGARVVLIEKESQLALHASGRNSGVLHAGFYYSTDSLKARFTREGNERLRAYCVERSLPINGCGKLVVANDETELETLGKLYRRGKENGVDIHEISAAEAREIEPRIKTFERALYSPTTASVDPKAVMDALARDAAALGVELRVNNAYLESRNGKVETSEGSWSVGYVINAAGLYADRIAKDFGFGESYAIIPFKGLYLYSDEPVSAFRANIYPVPDLRNPFLGVHITLTASGRIKIGPTAIPCLWREHYDAFHNFSFRDLREIVPRELGLWWRNEFDFRRLAFEELRKYSRKHIVTLASRLATGIEPGRCRHWGAPGIRAQLYDTRNRKLVMDFRFEGDDRSFHVLNAVSPAFTCALPFTEFMFDHIDGLLNKSVRASGYRLRRLQNIVGEKGGDHMQAIGGDGMGPQ